MEAGALADRVKTAAREARLSPTSPAPATIADAIHDGGTPVAAH